MARERKKAPAPVRGVRTVKTRRAKLEKAQQQLQQQQQHDDTWRNLNPLKEPPKMKHKTTFELVENVDKKKKLEFKITTDRQPPPGFEFVPVGHPTLSQMCKDMSREQDAMIFIVSDGQNPDNLEHHMNRVGYHFRHTIADEARTIMGATGRSVHVPQPRRPGEPEPIPRSQEEIDAQADAVLRDLFPRIPNTDRREIIQHAFRKDGKFHGESRVGMVKELTLARRVQLAAIAHIRHTHTRYDKLLKETSWANARKAVEKPCLDLIVKWRGDEETGRDQLDEILREVIEISDTEEDSEDGSPTADPTALRRLSAVPVGTLSRYTADPTQMGPTDLQSPQARRHGPSVPGAPTLSKQRAIARAEKKSARKTQRFRRYAAAAEALAGTADHRVHPDGSNVAPLGAVPMNLTRSPGSVQIIDSSREPTVAARGAPGTPSVEQMPRHFKLRTDPQRLNGNSRRERAPTIPHGLPEVHGHDSPRLGYIPKLYSPKVGHLSTNYRHPQSTLSPVRNGLQDMLLQSIEPASPVVPRQSQEISHAPYHGPKRLAEAPHIIPRTFREPVGSISRPWSPRVMSDGNELIAKRRRGADYPSDTFGAYAGSSFVQIHRQDRDEDLRRVPAGHYPDRPVSPFRPTGGPVPRNQLQPIPSDAGARYSGDAPLRTRADPIMIDEPIHRPRQVVEVRQHNIGDYSTPLRRGEPISHLPARRDVHIQDGSQVVYIDAPPTRPRSAFDYRGPIGPPNHGLSPYHESNVPRVPAPEYQRHADAPVDYHYREPLHNQHLVGRVESPGNVFRDPRAAPLGPDRPEVHYASPRHNFQERPDFAPISNPHQDRREVYYYRVDEPREAALPQMEYRRNHQSPLVAPPAHDHYMNGYKAPLRYLPPEHRVVYVDR
ncbi:hypothetical protein F4804DRAFT_305397 [Jackrogersella minutella]|nr:hypothetical protein F4804DRAFT_305397 [Jackrogersella minutella]